jgi:hypothetical protein
MELIAMESNGITDINEIRIILSGCVDYFLQLRSVISVGTALCTGINIILSRRYEKIIVL